VSGFDLSDFILHLCKLAGTWCVQISVTVDSRGCLLEWDPDASPVQLPAEAIECLKRELPLQGPLCPSDVRNGTWFLGTPCL
jgi:hypothetical protein